EEPFGRCGQQVAVAGVEMAEVAAEVDGGRRAVAEPDEVEAMAEADREQPVPDEGFLEGVAAVPVGVEVEPQRRACVGLDNDVAVGRAEPGRDRSQPQRRKAGPARVEGMAECHTGHVKGPVMRSPHKARHPRRYEPVCRTPSLRAFYTTNRRARPEGATAMRLPPHAIYLTALRGRRRSTAGPC